MIRFACPVCKKVYKASDDVAGKRSRCKQCHAEVIVPERPNQVHYGIPLPEGPLELPPDNESSVADILPVSLLPVGQSQTSPALPPPTQKSRPLLKAEDGEPDIREFRRKRRRTHAMRRIKRAGLLLCAIACSAVILSLITGWPISWLNKQLPAGLGKPDTLDAVVKKLQDKRVVFRAVPGGPERQFDHNPMYVLFGQPKERTIPCYLVEFPSEAAMRNYWHFKIAASNQPSNAAEQAAVIQLLKRFDDNTAEGFCTYGRFSFVSDDFSLIQQIRDALR